MENRTAWYWMVDVAGYGTMWDVTWIICTGYASTVSDISVSVERHYFISQYLLSAPSSCGSPDKLLNTTIEGTDYSVKSTIKYHCPLGHMLIGHAERICGVEGFWSGQAPTCKCKYSFVQCSSFNNLVHKEANFFRINVIH